MCYVADLINLIREIKMSIGLDKDGVSTEMARQIRKFTHIIPTTVRMGNQVYKSRQPIYFVQQDSDYIYLPFNLACRLLQSYPHDDLCYPTVDFDTIITPRDYQEGIIDEAWQQLTNYRTTTLKLYTGCGKTIIACYLMCQISLRTLIVVPNLDLAIQWTKVIHENTSARVGILRTDGRVDHDDTIITPDEVDVMVAYHQRLKKLPEETLARFGLLILDEAHMLAVESNIDNFFKIHPKYIITCTATLARKDGFHRMIQLVSGDHYVKRTIPHSFRVVRVPTDYTPDPKTTPKGVDYTDLVRLISSYENRNRKIIELCRRELEVDASCRGLILTSRVEHVEELSKLAKMYGIGADVLYGNRKSYIERSLLIGTYKKIGVGFDEANYLPNFSGRKFKYLIIAVPIKYDKRQDNTATKVDQIKEGGFLEQIIGRVMRIDRPTIYYLIDNHPVLVRHWNSSVMWFRQFDRCQILDVE